jgi:fused signal recognition particle receptor
VRNWFKKTQKNSDVPSPDPTPEFKNEESMSEHSSLSAWQRLRNGLRKTRTGLLSGFARFFKNHTSVSDEYWEELEEILIAADFGLKTTHKIIDYLKQLIKREGQLDGDAIRHHLSDYLVELLHPIHREFVLSPELKPHVILMVGVNGVGKTTSLAKLAVHFKQRHKVMMAAGDTFRAAAIEQLQQWGERYTIPVVAQGLGADSAAVLFDALQSAQARGIDVLLADTAGRLHTQSHLIQELQKVKRVMQKLNVDAPKDIFLVLDASIGQNALMQVKQFHEAMGLTGIIITKLDGTAKGGILFSIAQEFKIPCYFIGIGEGVDDLRPFDPKTFVQAILG